MEVQLNKQAQKEAVDLVTAMMAVPGKPGHEAKIAELIKSELKQIGIPDKAVSHDTANRKSPFGGEIGNLIVKLPGTVKAPRRLLMAHIDTVPLCVGCKPIRKGNTIRSKDPTTALGGDDRAGAAVVLNTIKNIVENDLPHPPLTLLWTIQEEVGLIGARYVTASKLGKPDACFNWDGGAANMAVIGATGDDHLQIEVHGIASHAGAHPEDGVSAIAIASMAMASLVEDGWWGLIQKGKKSGTSNIGFINGGEATNVVTDHVTLTGEARSHDPKFRKKIVTAIEKAFVTAVKKLKNASGKTGHVEFESRHKYESFRISPKAPVVKTAVQAIEQSGLTPETRISNGGLDANWMTANGFPTVTLGCGQSGIHTVNEELHVDTFLDACQIAMLIGTGAV